MTTSNVEESLLDDETDDSELDEEERVHVTEKAAACKFAIEQFYEGFWRYSAQREARYEFIMMISTPNELNIGLVEAARST